MSHLAALSTDIDYSYDNSLCSYIADRGILSFKSVYSGQIPAPPALSGDQNFSELDKDDWEYDFDNRQSVIDYCTGRLNEIRTINELSHSPSAFSCIVAYIGALSAYVYGRKTNDKVAFVKFCNNYVKELRCELEICTSTAPILSPRKCGIRTRWYSFCKRNKILSWLSGRRPQEVDTSFAGVLYESVRCGIVHSLSLSSHDIGRARKIRMFITHDSLSNAKMEQIKDRDLYDLVPNSCQYLRVKISAIDLCNAIDKAIALMFSSNGSVSERKIIERFKSLSPITLVKK